MCTTGGMQKDFKGTWQERYYKNLFQSSVCCQMILRKLNKLVNTNKACKFLYFLSLHHRFFFFFFFFLFVCFVVCFFVCSYRKLGHNAV
jgi:lipopolysaccharide export LptBFGC system permease protein LptF